MNEGVKITGRVDVIETTSTAQKESSKREYYCNHLPSGWWSTGLTRMNTCLCGKNVSCPVCGFGWGQYPCDCTPEIKIGWLE